MALLARLLEWLAATHNERFHLFRDARKKYEGYIRAHETFWDALTPNDFAHAHHDPGLESARRQLVEAVRMCHEQSAAADEATGLLELGMVQHRQGRFDEALESFSAALAIQTNLPGGGVDEEAARSCCLFHLGVLCWRKGRHAEALQQLQESMKIDQAHNDLQGIVQIQRALGKLP